MRSLLGRGSKKKCSERSICVSPRDRRRSETGCEILRREPAEPIRGSDKEVIRVRSLLGRGSKKKCSERSICVSPGERRRSETGCEILRRELAEPIQGSDKEVIRVRSLLGRGSKKKRSERSIWVSSRDWRTVRRAAASSLGSGLDPLLASKQDPGACEIKSDPTRSAARELEGRNHQARRLAAHRFTLFLLLSPLCQNST